MKRKMKCQFAKLFGISVFLALGSIRALADNPIGPAYTFDEGKVGISARFVLVKAGTFKMGGNPRYEDGRSKDPSQITVTLTKDFEMQATPVTQLQYFAAMGFNPSWFAKSGDCDGNNYQVLLGMGLCANHPVEMVSWEDAQAFIAKLNASQGKYNYRLPTEAEMEYATRGGMPANYPFSFGPNPTDVWRVYGFNWAQFLGDFAWYEANSSGRTHAVGLKKPNPYGLYDVYGNVWELVQDYSGDYPKGPLTDPTGPADPMEMVPAGFKVYRDHIIRGGCYGTSAGFMHSSDRGYRDAQESYNNTGFRLVRTLR